MLFDLLRKHSQISGFRNTGVPMDEGQHLQSVYPADRAHGGPGWFGFDRAAHLTETSPLVTEGNRERLLTDWARYWDTRKPFLLEKSPPNLIRTRFLQALFPRSRFIIIRRHPVAVVLATVKWSRNSLWSLFSHWITCHQIWRQDRRFISNYIELTYEDLINDPAGEMGRIYTFLGIDPPDTPLSGIDPFLNQRYFQMWQILRRERLIRLYVKLIERMFEGRIREFGYSFCLDKAGGASSPSHVK